MKRWIEAGAVLAVLTSCIGEPDLEGTQAQARSAQSLRCGQTASSGFWAYSGLGALAGASLEDVYELRATPGQRVSLVFRAHYDEAFGVGITVTDARSGEILTKVEKWDAAATVEFDAAPAGWHRIVVVPLTARARVYARVCEYAWHWKHGEREYGYGCESGWGYRMIGGDVEGGYSLRASCDCGAGCPCNAGGVDGVCIDVGECDGAPTAGLCPGSAAIQCCTSPRATAPETAAPDQGTVTGCPGAPQEWRCACSYYAAGDGCDCECGAPDPDCDDPAQPAFGCADGQSCGAAGHCETEAPADHGPVATCTMAPEAWGCDCSYYAAGDGCDCECGAPDPDCDDPAQQDLAQVFGCAEGQSCSAEGHCEW